MHFYSFFSPSGKVKATRQTQIQNIYCRQTSLYERSLESKKETLMLHYIMLGQFIWTRGMLLDSYWPVQTNPQVLLRKVISLQITPGWTIYIIKGRKKTDCMMVLLGQLTECTCKPARGKQANHRALTYRSEHPQTLCPVTSDQVIHTEHLKIHFDWFKVTLQKKGTQFLPVHIRPPLYHRGLFSF